MLQYYEQDKPTSASCNCSARHKRVQNFLNTRQIDKTWWLEVYCLILVENNLVVTKLISVYGCVNCVTLESQLKEALLELSLSQFIIKLLYRVI
jgi:hypothetical protein